MTLGKGERERKGEGRGEERKGKGQVIGGREGKTRERGELGAVGGWG